jgi:CRP-like cAMP-binding protein
MAGHTAIKAHAVLEMFSDMFKSERQKKNDRETGVKVVYGPNEQDLGVGNSFGEIGLMSDNKRVRTVVAKEDCVMFEIKKDVYLRTVRNRKQLRDVHTVVSSLKAVRDLHGLSFALLDDLARSVDVRTFHRNEEVSSQGDGGNFVYCLIQGSVKAVRYYNVKQTPITDSKRTSAKQSHILSAQQLNERHVLLEAFNSNITRVLGEEDSMSEYAKEQKRNKASIVEAQLAQYHQVCGVCVYVSMCMCVCMHV